MKHIPAHAPDDPISYQCHYLDAGTTDWDLWVSIGFHSPGYHDADALHIVCGFHDDEDEVAEGIHLERKDQSQGGTGLAEDVLLLADRIRVSLTDRGMAILGFDCRTLEFLFPRELGNAGKVAEHFARMLAEANGAQIRIG
ncbi:hypothetical protein VDF98_03375 [Xanthomonas campestris pv. raphani]|uniref:hypothetical protein n=1 Tax=Pseudomonadota TaxID=1224 RepID=UPI00236844F7|nr:MULTISPECIES: hypothetical protein [Pseudomonadota]MEA9822422.1 hypothetical protein [Xanthomonas campestris pv. raphani]MEA9850845.1 hypothetical protein [Xanthomonas campestris pv. raphani]MEA9855018.1 hypothetical protein [Xanthomonas campestris pv. raphani]MEA9963865.1 hypothetical protein [Xanthomonas campestris pv. raphani]WDJ24301.1 hypothetical protein JH270_10615 [Xanthomonas campestris pv. raphani]